MAFGIAVLFRPENTPAFLFDPSPYPAIRWQQNEEERWTATDLDGTNLGIWSINNLDVTCERGTNTSVTHLGVFMQIDIDAKTVAVSGQPEAITFDGNVLRWRGATFTYFPTDARR